MGNPLSGLSAFPITPSSPDGMVDTVALGRLVRPLVEAGVDSIGLLGSTGTYPFFSRTERRRALDTALTEANGRVPILVGIGALRTDEAVAIARDAKAAGAAAGLLAAVSYAPLTENEVFTHFAAVASGSGLPICIYDNPTTTHFRFSTALVQRLAALDEVVSIKIPAAPADGIVAQVDELRRATPAGFSIGSSIDWHSTDALLAGCDSWYSVAAGLFPVRCLAILRAARAGEIDTARRLHGELEPLWALFRAHSSLRIMFAAAQLRGLDVGAPPLPILPLPADVSVRLAAVMNELELA